MKATHTTRRSGFTLVELLVVIGIIALLISILLPSLNQARERALVVNCAANQRSFGQSVQMFVNDNDLQVPGDQSGFFESDNQGSHLIPWTPGYMGAADYFQLIDTYGAAPEAIVCPSVSFRETEPNPATNFTIFDFDDYTPYMLVWPWAGVTGAGGDGESIDTRNSREFERVRDLLEDWASTTNAGSLQRLQNSGNANVGVFADLGSFWYLGQPANLNGNVRQPWMINKITDQTDLGYGSDSNPILLSDRVFVDSGVPVFNHGEDWVPVGDIELIANDDSSDYENVGSPTRPDITGAQVPWERPTLTERGKPGDIRVNALSTDGSVQFRQLLSEQGLYQGGSTSFFY